MFCLQFDTNLSPIPWTTNICINSGVVSMLGICFMNAVDAVLQYIA